MPEGPPRVGQDPEALGLISGTQHGKGTLTIPALSAQGTALLRIENRIGNSITLRPRSIGRQVAWENPRRPQRQIAVVAPAEAIRLAFVC